MTSATTIAQPRDPAELRPHRLGHPGEAGAAVRVGLVHVVVAAGDQEHRHEADQQDRRRLQGDRGGDEAEGGGEAVAGGGRGDSDHDAGDEADRVLLQALVGAAADRGSDGMPVEPGAGTAALSIRSPSVESAPPCPRRSLNSRSDRADYAQVANVPKAWSWLIQLVQVNTGTCPSEHCKCAIPVLALSISS